MSSLCQNICFLSRKTKEENAKVASQSEWMANYYNPSHAGTRARINHWRLFFIYDVFLEVVLGRCSIGPEDFGGIVV